MNTLKNDIILRKEGIYWTLYIGETECGCGDFDDMIDEITENKDLIQNDPETYIKKAIDFR